MKKLLDWDAQDGTGPCPNGLPGVDAAKGPPGAMVQRAYSVLTIKSVDDDERIIEGIATTPTTDRAGDIVEPMGAEFTLPMPFLWHHDAKHPIGTVFFAKPNKEGIPFKARIAKAGVATFIDEAWALIKEGLVRGASIGFKSIESARIKDTFAEHFTKWLWLELSAVTIPANAEANILTIKSADQAMLLTASGGSQHSKVVRLTSTPGASGSQLPKGAAMKTIQERIASFESKRAANVARNEAIMNKAAEEGRTLDEGESQEYDNLAAEVKQIDEHLVRERAQQATMVEKAVPITEEGTSTPEAATATRNGSPIVMKDNLPPGIEFARYVKCLAAAKGNLMQAAENAKTHYPDQPRIGLVLKAAVAAGTTTDATWAAPLVQYQQFAGDFIEFLRPQTIVGKFGTNGIPSLFRVPFNIQIPSQTSGGTGYWVGEGAPKPLTKFDFATTTMRWAKVAAISVLTNELVRFSSPSADLLVRNALSAALVERIDIDFIDPDKAAVANVSPASITNSVTPLTSAGPTAANVKTDVRAIFAAYIAANMTPANGVWIMSATTALALSMAENALGQPEFPDLTMNGGRFFGLPVIVSQYVRASGSPTETLLILVNASDVYLADDGQVVIDASDQASLQMLDNPTNHSGTATPTTVVSMFQTNSVAIRAERFINWQKRTSAAVAYIENVAYAP